MNQHRTTDLAKAYRANDIHAASDRRRFQATVDATPTRTDTDPGIVGRPSRVSLTVRRFILRGA
jgi:hypothetical protein